MLSAQTRTIDEVGARADALALRLGTKVTASTILLAAVIVIVIGAQSLLSTMEELDRNVTALNEQLVVTNIGIGVLTKTMASVPASQRNLEGVVEVVAAKQRIIGVTTTRVEAMASSTESLDARLGTIADSTTNMRGSLEGAATGTTQLDSTVVQLSDGMDPLVAAQRSMYLGTGRMRSRIDEMNASLAYVVRQLNYIAEPPTGGGFTVRASLPKETLPPIPGIRAEVAPLQVFRRSVWPVYRRDPAT